MDFNTTIGIMDCFGSIQPIDIKYLRAQTRLGAQRWTARQYCDRRFNTDLQRFNYDPYIGEWIDWKKVRELLEE